MSRCKKCNIEILDETERCPLCNSVLEKTIEMENMYPNVRIMSRTMMRISKIYLFGAIMLEVLLVYINVTTDSKTWWSAISALSFLYVYMLLRYAILGKSGHKVKVIVLSLIAVLILVAADFLSGYRGWSVNYALPVIILLVDLCILILMFVNRRNWQSYMMWQLFMILCSVVSLVFSLIGIATRPFMGEFTFTVSVLLFVGTLIIGDRRAWTELKRRFHVR